MDHGSAHAKQRRAGGHEPEHRGGWRPLWVVVHRWAGLTLALFLVVAGLTGALLAFYPELHRATASWQRVAPPSPAAPLLDPVALLEAAQRAEPRAEFLRVELGIKPDSAVVFYPDPRPGIDLGYDELGIDPWTGSAVHRGTWGAISEGWHQVMPFIFELHYTLALGEVGRLAFGIAALVWTVDCFIGFYLTLPPGRRRWWERWRTAWQVRPWRSGAFRFNFDLHRAGGLWLWPLLLVFAWSSVGFNLRPVYAPVMAAFGASDPMASLRSQPAPDGLVHDWRVRLAQARAIAAERGAALGFTVLAEDGLSFRAGADAYEYRFHASDDLPTTRPQSRIWFDRESGAVIAHRDGRGDLDADGIDRWLVALHIGSIGGLPYRILVAIVGLGVVALSVTGIVIWMRKRSARLLGNARRRGPAATRNRTLAPIS
jgi:uncharacterized iron-regulated membrane protein